MFKDDFIKTILEIKYSKKVLWKPSFKLVSSTLLLIRWVYTFFVPSLKKSPSVFISIFSFRSISHSNLKSHPLSFFPSHGTASMSSDNDEHNLLQSGSEMILVLLKFLLQQTQRCRWFPLHFGALCCSLTVRSFPRHDRNQSCGGCEGDGVVGGRKVREENGVHVGIPS